MNGRKLTLYWLLLICFIHIVALPAAAQTEQTDKRFREAKGSWLLPVDSVISVDSCKPLLFCSLGCEVLVVQTAASAPVYSLHDGLVQGVLASGDSTWFVIVRCGSWYLVYHGLQRPGLEKGMKVLKGQLLGQVARDDEGKCYLGVRLQLGLELRDVYRWFNWDAIRRKQMQSQVFVHALKWGRLNTN